MLLAEKFGFEHFSGAFAAGTILGVATRGERGSVLREKMETLCFGWFYPFFFVGTGIQFDFGALGHDLTTMLQVPAFVALFITIRGAPVLLYRGQIDTRNSCRLRCLLQFRLSLSWWLLPKLG